MLEHDDEITLFVVSLLRSIDVPPWGESSSWDPAHFIFLEHIVENTGTEGWKGGLEGVRESSHSSGIFRAIYQAWVAKIA